MMQSSAHAISRVGLRSLALAPARGKSKPNLTAAAHSPCATAVLELRQGYTLCLSEPCVQKLGSEYASPESPTASKVLRAPTARRYKQARSAARDTRLGRRAQYRPEGLIGLSVWRGIREGACELVAA